MSSRGFVANGWEFVENCIICGHGKPTRTLKYKFKQPANAAEKRGVLVLRCCVKCYKKRTERR